MSPIPFSGQQMLNILGFSSSLENWLTNEIYDDLYRTMVWAVDMDDLNGTAIHSLGSGLNTNTSQIVPLTWPIIMDNGTFT